jgi:hypothetical protein
LLTILTINIIPPNSSRTGHCPVTTDINQQLLTFNK